MNNEFRCEGADASASTDRSMSRRHWLRLLGASGLTLAQPALRSVAMNAEGEPSPILETRLTREYAVRYPLVCAGMAFVGTELLAAIRPAAEIVTEMMEEARAALTATLR